jgi:hypothetical protein
MAAAAMTLAAGCCMAPGAWASGELGITVSGAPDQLIVGDILTLTATVTNNDPVKVGTDARVVFNPVIDPFQDAPVVQGSGCFLFIALSCPLFGDLAPGQSRQAQITSSLPALGLYAIDVGANAELLGGDFTDPPLNSPTVRYETTVEPKADVKLDLGASAESVANGAPFVIRGLVTNTKTDGTAYGASVRFSVPPGAEILSKPADCTGSVLNLVCPVGDLGPLLTAQRELTLRSTAEGAYTVLGTVSWARPDTTPVDTQGQITVTVLPPPDTTPTPTPTPTKPATPKPKTVSAGTVAQGVPASGSCRRLRRLTLVLRSRGTWDPIRATIRVTGRKKALILKGTRAQRPFTLTLPRRRGKVRLQLDVTYDNGRRYKATRTFRRC